MSSRRKLIRTPRVRCSRLRSLARGSRSVGWLCHRGALPCEHEGRIRLRNVTGPRTSPPTSVTRTMHRMKWTRPPPRAFSWRNSKTVLFSSPTILACCQINDHLRFDPANGGRVSSQASYSTVEQVALSFTYTSILLYVAF